MPYLKPSKRLIRTHYIQSPRKKQYVSFTSILFIILFSPVLIAQIKNIPDNLVGAHYIIDNSNRIKIVTNPVPHKLNISKTNHAAYENIVDTNTSHIRYSYGEQYGVGYSCAESGSGLYSAVAWSFSGQRISLFGNTNNYSLWDFQTPGTIMNYTSISDTGGFIAAGSGANIFLLNRITGMPVQVFNLSSLSDTGAAGPVAITSAGDFFIGSAVRTDSSTVMGFHNGSNLIVWRYRIPNELFGLKMSGNDSLIIINSYSRFWVLKTYTGESIYQGLINPFSNDGTQTNQGISGNGNIIATVNYDGYLRVYHWNGTTYFFLWEHQENPGQFYNWMTSVDVSYDGNRISCGTLDFISDTVFDGKVKMFNTFSGSSPQWTYEGCGDEVSSVMFSKNGRILCAASWGNLHNPSVNNLLVFKTSNPNNIPLYAISGAGSFFCSGISNDGQTVIGSGREVHARSYGSGGTFYNLFIDTSAMPIGIQNNHNIQPADFKLFQNYPNPFNPSTVINYQLPSDGYVKLAIYDAIGKQVDVLINRIQKAGNYKVEWDATNYPSGVYLCRIVVNMLFEKKGTAKFADTYNNTKKMILLK
jgi:hypothetical protein